MAGRPAHPRGKSTIADIKLLRARGLTMAQVATKLGMSRATLYRILDEGSYHPRGSRTP